MPCWDWWWDSYAIRITHFLLALWIFMCSSMHDVRPAASETPAENVWHIKHAKTFRREWMTFNGIRNLEHDILKHGTIDDRSAIQWILENRFPLQLSAAAIRWNRFVLCIYPLNVFNAGHVAASAAGQMCPTQKPQIRFDPHYQLNRLTAPELLPAWQWQWRQNRQCESSASTPYHTKRHRHNDP